MTAPQQFSPDGQWWWDGTQWVPASQAPVPQQPSSQPSKGAEPFAMPGGETPAGQAPAQGPFAPYGQPPAYGQPYGQPSPYGQQPHGQPPYGYPAGPPYGARPTGTDGKAIGSLILSILWLFGVGSIVAVILGHVSRSQAQRQGRQPSGVALAGLIIGYLGIAGAILVALFAVAFKDEIVSAIDVELELQSAAEAEHSYHDANARYTADLDELEAYGYLNPNGEHDIQVISATSTTFCLSATSFDEVRYVDQNHSTPTSTPCR